MENVLIQGTKKTPFVKFDAKEGVVEISGNSIPEDPAQFYQPLDELFEKYASKTDQFTFNSITVNVKLNYFNTGSSKWILFLFMKFKEIHTKNPKVKINWYYEEGDDDCFEAGESYKNILGIPFDLVEYIPGN